MRKRFHRAFTSTFEQAVEAKRVFEAENPDGQYQIRRRARNYEVVIRLESKDVPIEKAKDIYTKKRSRGKRHVDRKGI